MKPDDFLKTIPPTADDLWPLATQVPQTELFEQLRQNPLPGIPDLDAGTALTKLVHRELEAFGTKGSKYLEDDDMAIALKALRATLHRIGVDLPQLPFRDFSTFYDYWKREGMSGSYQARRDCLDETFGPLYNKFDALEERQMAARLATAVSPRGRLDWPVIDNEIEELRQRFAAATTSLGYSVVGTACVRILESLGDVVYDPKLHLREGEQPPGRDKTKLRIGRFVEDAVAGSDNAELRKLVTASVELAHKVKHQKTPSRVSAGIAADSVIMLANLLRRLATKERAS